MNQYTQQLLTLVASGNDLFATQHACVSTIVGLLEQRLKDANAVTVDNIKHKQRLMFILLDTNPEIVGVGTGQSGTEDFVFIQQFPLNELTAVTVVELMEKHLIV
jgi:hypothetical protein